MLGKCGCVMRELEQQTGATCKVDQSTKREGFSTIRITGTEGAVESAKSRIGDLIQNASRAPSDFGGGRDGADHVMKEGAVEGTRGASPRGGAETAAMAFSSPSAPSGAPEEEMQIDQTKVGFVVGKAGCVVRQLEQETGASIFIG